MKRTHRFYIIVSLLSLLAIVLGSCTGAPKGTLTLAVAESNPGSEKDPYAHSIYAGAKLAADHINELGGVNGFVIKVVPYADNNDPLLAAQNAQTIVESNAVAVIGHSSSESSSAAAPVYTQAGLPVVNASPVSSESISATPNIFNIAYTTQQQGAYLANYTVKALGYSNANIVYSDDAFGQTLSRKFENTFNGLGGTVSLHESIPVTKDGIQPKDLDAIVAKLFTIDPQDINPSVLFIAASGKDSAELVIALKNRGFTHPIIGGDNLSTLSFLERVQKESGEQARPGYFTDGLIATRTLLPDSARGFASQFVRDYQQAYPNFPVSNSAARGYDAALAIFKAVQNSQINNNNDSQQSRAAVMDALRGMNDPKTAAYGVTGPLYFDQDRNSVRQVLLVFYQYGNLISAPTQYEPILLIENVQDLKQQIIDGLITPLDGDYVYITNVVYTGMDMIELRELDQKASTYNADFYLWFRYKPQPDKQNFKPENIVFTNAESISSKDTVREETLADGSIYKTLRVSGTFKNQFNFQAYPFDRQDLTIEFRNQSANASFLQYVVDRPGMRYPSDTDLLMYMVKNGVFDPLYGWSPKTAHVEQKLFSTVSTLGDPQNFDNTITTDFSEFDVRIRVERNSLVYIFKSILPLLITLALAYITFYLPLGHSERLGVGSTALLTTAFFHFSLASSLPEIGYTVAMEYFFYAAYFMSTLIVFLETLSIRLEKKAEDIKDEVLKAQYGATRQRLNVIGRIVYPVILLSVLGMGAFAYLGFVDLNPESRPIRRPTNIIAQVQQPASTPTEGTVTADTGPITLQLNTWRPEDDSQIRILLQAFHEQNPDITIIHQPISGVSYDEILRAQLANGRGPDLFFVPPFDRKYSNSLLNITTLPIKTSFDESKRTPWQSKDGNYYALPYVGVIQGIYYNKDVFKKLNLPVPTTWEDFLLTAQTLKDAGYIPIANGMKEDEESDMFMTLTPSFLGGQSGRKAYMSTGPGARCFNDPNAVRAFQSMADVHPYLSDDATVINSYTSKERFINQTAAMLFGGSWDVHYFSEKAKFDWGVFASPAPAGRQTYVIFQPDIAIGVNSNISASHQQAALRFLEWLMTPESLSVTGEILPGFFPLSNIKTDKISNVHSAEFQKLATNYQTDVRWAYSELFLTNQQPSAPELIQSAIYDMIANGLSAQEAADRMQAGMSQWYEPAQVCGK